MMKILAIPGSLRLTSSSNHILNAVVSTASAEASVEIFDGVGKLPHFNDPAEAPEIVAGFRNKIREADAVLICTPEYAFGVPGSLKNALDWTVSSGEFVNKPVALITASTSGEKAHESLLNTLTALSAKTYSETNLLISFIRSKLDGNGQIKD